jgi:hypothetical protein
MNYTPCFYHYITFNIYGMKIKKKDTTKKPGKSITKIARKLAERFGGEPVQTDDTFATVVDCYGLFIYIEMGEGGITTAGINGTTPGEFPVKQVKELLKHLNGCGFHVDNFEILMVKN